MQVELIDLSLQQRTNRAGCARIGAGGIVQESISNKLLKLGKNPLAKRLGRAENAWYRNHDAANCDPCLVRRGLVRHREQIERTFIEPAVQKLQVKSQKPNERLAGRAAKNPPGAGFERLDVLIELGGGPRPQRSLRQRYFHEHHRPLGMGVAGAQALRSLALQGSRQRRVAESLEPEQATFDVPKIIRRLALRKRQNSPNQAHAADCERQGSLNQ